jgi:hypothetical protein
LRREQNNKYLSINLFRSCENTHKYIKRKVKESKHPEINMGKEDLPNDTDEQYHHQADASARFSFNVL